jgi:hypothetical protein
MAKWVDRLISGWIIHQVGRWWDSWGGSEGALQPTEVPIEALRLENGRLPSTFPYGITVPRDTCTETLGLGKVNTRTSNKIPAGQLTLRSLLTTDA